ncbi:phosphate ABC transporter substrate-binding protein PstS [Apibacter muscae]|uniref:phosphate ABC transporter substrate-binding protein PstS n=1 Tax=Apibacter muscae TaxID=2509004 RepID=UPI0011AD658A|nr:phosphate ABC transporter substrate-binding protein PstS [Apibacter muscae]TWP28569.1 phosphate ABC transporter substrate-binding protein PstS [Apibacter muscae]
MKKNIFLLFTALIALVACNSGGEKKGTKLSGAGATFPAPFYTLVFKDFTKKTGNEVTYGATGSGSGIRSLKDRTVDFGATDVYLSEEEIKEMGGNILHIPTAMGAVVLSYNLPGIDKINLTSSIISDIYLGNIKNWNDPKIKEINPEINFPDLEITPVYRSDGSGTTFVFTDYMSKVNQQWKDKIGAGKSLEFPKGIAAKGNPGIAGIISKTKGAIGYIGSEYALAQNIPFAALQNSSGKFIEANSKSISASANVDLPDDTRIMISNSSSPDAYPISTFTWIIVYQEQDYNNRGEEKARALKNLLNFIVSPESQEGASRLNYAPIPEKAVERVHAILNTMTYNGKPVAE